MEKPCGICARKNMDTQAALAQLAEYIESLPEEMRVVPEEFDRRIEACLACPQQVQGTCSLCGCFVQARAAKWRLRCPDTRSPRWLQGQPMKM